MDILPKQRILSKAEARRRQEFKFLGRGVHRPGLILFGYDAERDKLYRVKIEKREAFLYDKQRRKSTSHYRATINPEHFIFYALNEKNAKRKVLKIKKIIRDGS